MRSGLPHGGWFPSAVHQSEFYVFSGRRGPKGNRTPVQRSRARASLTTIVSAILRRVFGDVLSAVFSSRFLLALSVSQCCPCIHASSVTTGSLPRTRPSSGFRELLTRSGHLRREGDNVVGDYRLTSFSSVGVIRGLQHAPSHTLSKAILGPNQYQGRGSNP